MTRAKSHLQNGILHQNGTFAHPNVFAKIVFASQCFYRQKRHITPQPFLPRQICAIFSRKHSNSRSQSVSLFAPQKQHSKMPSTLIHAIRLLLLCSLSLIANGQMFLSAADEKRNFGREFLPFGKRAPAEDAAFNRDFMAFGKRAPTPDAAFQRDFMAFGKRSAAGDAFQRDFMAFGKRVPDPFQRDFMTFGKRAANGGGGFEREFMAFGRRK